MRRRLPGAAALLLLLLPPQAGRAARADDSSHTVRVFAAASLAEAFAEIAATLERREPGLDVQLHLAGSQQLALQIEHGARADVFASADERWMQRLRDADLVDGEPVRFAHNRLVVLIPAANPAGIRSLADLARTGVKLVIAADAVPAGRYSRIALANLGRDPALGPGYADAVLRNVVSEEENVRAVVGKVQLGEADAGIAYRSDVTPAARRFVRTIAIPDSANVLAAYPIALVAGARAPAPGRAFIAFVTGPEGRRILERHGLIAEQAP